MGRLFVKARHGSSDRTFRPERASMTDAILTLVNAIVALVMEWLFWLFIATVRGWRAILFKDHREKLISQWKTAGAVGRLTLSVGMFLSVLAAPCIIGVAACFFA